MEMGHERHFQIAGLNRRDPVFERCGLGTTHDARSEIDEVSPFVDRDHSGWTRSIRVGHWRSGAEKHYFSAGCLAMRGDRCYRARPVLPVHGLDAQEYQAKECEFGGQMVQRLHVTVTPWLCGIVPECENKI